MSIRIIKTLTANYRYGTYKYYLFEKIIEHNKNYIFNECRSCKFFDKKITQCTFDKTNTEDIRFLEEDWRAEFISEEEYKDALECYEPPLEYCELEDECIEFESINKYEKDIFEMSDDEYYLAIAEDDSINFLRDNLVKNLSYLKTKKISL